METKFYNTNNLKQRKLFYMLDNIIDESVKLFRRTPAGDEEFTSYDLHRMPDGKLLIAFHHYWGIQTIHSLIAICGNQEEHVNTQPFERIMLYWNLGNAMPTGEKGVFCFLDSQSIHDPKDEWRCDTTSYGPLKYLGVGEQRRVLLSELAQIKVYEPIISINGISSIVYMHRNDDDIVRNYVINAEEVPSFTVTLSEMFKLLTEWAVLADEPFNSTQDIVLDAKAFLNKINFDSSLVADQTNMQIAQYLLGDTDARRRPYDVVETNQELLNFVKRKMAHMSLSSALSCYPEYANLDAEIQRDIESADNEFFEDISNMRIEGNFSLDNYKDCLDLIPDNYVNGKQAFGFRWSILKQKKDSALSLQNK